MATVQHYHQAEDQDKQLALRNMDLLMYVLYSEDAVFVMNMVKRAATEIADKYDFEDLRTLIRHNDKPMLYRCLFFLVLNFHKPFRFWVLTDGTLGLKPICPFKATRFLLCLKNEIVPRFLMDERVQLEELERQIKTTYVCS
jgi:hypothetical protein